MEISPSIEGPGEHGVIDIQVGEKALDGQAQNSGGHSEREATFIADGPGESNLDSGTASAFADELSENSACIRGRADMKWDNGENGEDNNKWIVSTYT